MGFQVFIFVQVFLLSLFSYSTTFSLAKSNSQVTCINIGQLHIIILTIDLLDSERNTFSCRPSTQPRYFTLDFVGGALGSFIFKFYSKRLGYIDDIGVLFYVKPSLMGKQFHVSFNALQVHSKLISDISFLSRCLATSVTQDYNSLLAADH